MKKTLVGMSAIAGLLLGAGSLIAAAQTNVSANATIGTNQPKQEMRLEVGPNGKALIRGTITAISGNTISVKSWGGTWNVNVVTSTEILPAAAGNTLSQFKVGDYLGAQGTVSQSANWTVDATVVRDWTYRQAVNDERKENVQSARETMKSGAPRNFEGTASGVTSSSFTLTENGTAYTVNVATGAQIVNRIWLTLPFASIQNGNTVRVWGVNASGTITAQIIRDISIPAVSIQ